MCRDIQIYFIRRVWLTHSAEITHKWRRNIRKSGRQAFRYCVRTSTHPAFDTPRMELSCRYTRSCTHGNLNRSSMWKIDLCSYINRYRSTYGVCLWHDCVCLILWKPGSYIRHKYFQIKSFSSVGVTSLDATRPPHCVSVTPVFTVH